VVLNDPVLFVDKLNHHALLLTTMMTQQVFDVIDKSIQYKSCKAGVRGVGVGEFAIPSFNDFVGNMQLRTACIRAPVYGSHAGFDFPNSFIPSDTGFDTCR